MRKLLIFFFLLFAVFSLFSADTVMVYITKTGKSYHREWCVSLKKSKIAITVKDAIARGYSPCHRCKPVND